MSEKESTMKGTATEWNASPGDNVFTQPPALGFNPPALMATCCGRPILPKWQKAINRAGEEFCALVWGCPSCHLITYRRLLPASLVFAADAPVVSLALEAQDNNPRATQAARSHL
jgi:hypothetical protein